MSVYKVYDMIVKVQREVHKSRDEMSYSDLQRLKNLLAQARTVAGRYKF